MNIATSGGFSKCWQYFQDLGTIELQGRFQHTFDGFEIKRWKYKCYCWHYDLVCSFWFLIRYSIFQTLPLLSVGTSRNGGRSFIRSIETDPKISLPYKNDGGNNWKPKKPACQSKRIVSNSPVVFLSSLLFFLNMKFPGLESPWHIVSKFSTPEVFST